jgi:hypothetical protein
VQHRTFLVGFVALSLVACQDFTPDDGFTPDDTRLKVPLPAYQAADLECDGDPNYEDISLCDWFSSADAAVVGVITEVRFADEPTISLLDPDTLLSAEECGTSSNPTIVFEVSVSNVLVGDAPSVIDIRLGEFFTALLRPRPEQQPDGLRWFMPGEEVRGPEPGDIVGAVVHRIDTDLGTFWSVRGEPMFALIDDGALFVQEIPFECLPQAPSELGAMRIQDVARAAADCGEPSPEADARRERVRRGSPLFSFAAVCLGR